jgi:hypothetical protein
MKKILILGGYGNFGRRIATFLAKEEGLNIIINGRNKKKAEQLSSEIKNKYPKAKINTAIFDSENSLDNELKNIKPFIVINTCGPFQLKNYDTAKTCIKNKIHYIDLADGTDYVNNIKSLDNLAKKSGVMVISGASTVPGLSSAVIDHISPKFKKIDSLKYGITPGQKTPRGLATTKAILTYLGKPLSQTDKNKKKRYGWQDLYKQDYPEIGKRWMANCDVPDIKLFPKYYKIKNIQFSAGMESSGLHLSLWVLSHLIKLRIPIPLMRFSSQLLKISHIFDIFGSKDGGMHMIFKGIDKNNKPKTIKWFIVAKNGDGPQIPSAPAAYLAKKIANGSLSSPGAMPCIGLIPLKDYLKQLSEFDIKISELKY